MLADAELWHSEPGTATLLGIAWNLSSWLHPVLQEQLEQQLETRKGELDKIDTLEEKLDGELAAIDATTATVQTELHEFEDLDALESAGKENEERLLEQQAALQGRVIKIEGIQAATAAAHGKSVRLSLPTSLDLVLNRLQHITLAARCKSSLRLTRRHSVVDFLYYMQPAHRKCTVSPVCVLYRRPAG